jgi:hypothetical protein
LNRSGDSGHPCLVPDFRGNGETTILKGQLSLFFWRD